MSMPDDKLWRRSKFKGEGWISTQDDPKGAAAGAFWVIEREPAEFDEFHELITDAAWVIRLYRAEQEQQLSMTLPMAHDSFMPSGWMKFQLNDGLAKELGVMRTALDETGDTGHLELTPRRPGESEPE